MKDLNLIRKIAWDFTKSTNLEYQDLFSEAALAYCEAVQDFDPNNGNKLITFAYWCMKNHLINYCKKETKFEDHVLLQDEWPDEIHPTTEESSVNVFDIIEQWPEDARQVAEMVLEVPERITLETPNYRRKYKATPHKSKKRIRQKLIQQGWTRSRANNAMKDVKLQLQMI